LTDYDLDSGDCLLGQIADHIDAQAVAVHNEGLPRHGHKQEISATHTGVAEFLIDW